jgi:hypothetical protein
VSSAIPESMLPVETRVAFEKQHDCPVVISGKRGKKSMRCVRSGVIALAVLAVTGIARAQSGHFVGTPVCTDQGTQVLCTGKVAGLGGATFEIRIEAPGTASVECTNPGENVAPGQDTEVTAGGSLGPQPTPRNGQYRFTLLTDDPEPLPPTPTCPNNQWTPVITDVSFEEATISLFEDSNLSDQVTVPVN